MRWVPAHLLSIATYLLALVLISQVLRARRAPSSTLAWLLVIALAPYAGVPLYLIFGGRKLKRMAAAKAPLFGQRSRDGEGVSDIERVLCTAGIPAAVDGCAVELLPTGEAAYRAIIEMLDGAKRSIHIATFILSGDEVGQAVLERLERKAAAGVEVRLLIDALFSFRADRRRLTALIRSGARVAYFMPVLHVPFRGHANLRNHRKIAVVDGDCAMVGGMNLAREYMGPVPLAGRWCDVSMRVRGPAVAAIDALFVSDWAFAAGETLARPTTPLPIDARSGAVLQVVPSGPDVASDALYDAILSGLFQARRRIWIATPYFIPDEALACALALAARRGVDVRIIVPARSNHRAADLAGARYLRQIEQAGGQVCPYLPGMLHAKVIVFDDSVGVLGSANFDMRSLFLDYEIALFFYSKEEIDVLAGWFERTRSDCSDRLAPAGRGRALAEDLGRLLAPLV